MFLRELFYTVIFAMISIVGIAAQRAMTQV